jgi:hypothetical protein
MGVKEISNTEQGTPNDEVLGRYWMLDTPSFAEASAGKGYWILDTGDWILVTGDW